MDDDVPDGNDESDNEEVSRWGDNDALPRQLGWNVDSDSDSDSDSDDGEDRKVHLWHDDVAAGLGGWRGEAAVAMSGSRFVALSGSVARLERAVSNFFLDLHASERGGENI